MYTLYDVNGYKGDFGSVPTITVLSEIADKLKLPVLQDFFKMGFSIGIEELIEDVESISYSFTEMEDVIKNFLEVLYDSDEMVIISNDII